MRQINAALLALACFGAQAGTYELSLTNPSFSVVDLTPSDQFAPSYTADAAGPLGFLTPVDFHDKGYRFEESTVLPPSIGPYSGYMFGTIGPGTELIWTTTVHLKISVIDTDNLWDYDSVGVQTSFYGTSPTSISHNSVEIITGLGGHGGTYQRLSQETDFVMDIHVTNPWDTPQQYHMRWFHQYQIVSYSIDHPATPVPEPEAYALLLAGLGVISAAVRRRKQKAIAA